MIKVIIYHLSKHNENGEVKARSGRGQLLYVWCYFFSSPSRSVELKPSQPRISSVKRAVLTNVLYFTVTGFLAAFVCCPIGRAMIWGQ